MPKYNVNMNVAVEADNIRDAVALATDLASLPQENATVVAVLMAGARPGDPPKVVQYGAES